MSQAPSPGESTRTSEIAWSDRQREVLDLLAARKTNGEIAEALGISLDGAKYHVREILDRLDVDTREEAAEWWRQQRGMKARMQVVMRRWRMPALLKLGGAAAATAVAVVAIGIYLASPGGDEEDGDSLDPGMWVALALPVVADAEQAASPESWELRAMRMDGSQPFVLADLSLPSRPAWSPDGSFVAIEDVEGDPRSSDRALVLVDASSGAIVRTPLGGTDYSHLRWSPDSEVLALYTRSTLLLMDRDGRIRAEVSLDELAGGAAPVIGNETLIGWPQWTTDSSRLVLPAGNEVAVIERDGSIVAVSDRDGWLPEGVDVQPPDPQTHYWPPMLDRWSADGEVVVRVPVGGTAEFWTVRGVVAGGDCMWEEEPGGAVPDYYAVDFGVVPPNWLQDHRPYPRSQALLSSVSYGGVMGAIALVHDDEEARLLPGSGPVPDGTRVALVIERDGAAEAVEIDISPEGVNRLVAGVLWDVVVIPEDG